MTSSISDQQFARALDDLKLFVEVPSVSDINNPDYNPENLEEAAYFANQLLKELDFSAEKIQIKDSPPFVLARKVVNAALPTMVLYAHYDVQPVDRNQWTSNPFVAEERDGRLYGRGASDDKAGVIGILTALRFFKESNRTLPVNVVVLFEGEEEYGSSHMNQFLRQEAAKVQGDALVVLDGLNKDVVSGTLMSSTRGLVNLAVAVNALEKPIHSGIGCLVPDPAQALASLVFSLNDPGKIPGFTDGIIPLNDQERIVLRESSLTDQQYAADNGMIEGTTLRGDSRLSVYERIVEEPSISIVNMNCGKPNGGNSIQNVATCTVGIRTAPLQDPDQVGQCVIRYLLDQPVKGNLPVEVEQQLSVWPWKGELSGPFSQHYLQALGTHFPSSCAMPCGGALPLLTEFQQMFPDMEMIVPGVEDPDTSAHSHNESQHLESWRHTINSLITFLELAGTNSAHKRKNT